jgi:hypothetical protein
MRLIGPSRKEPMDKSSALRYAAGNRRDRWRNAMLALQSSIRTTVIASLALAGVSVGSPQANAGSGERIGDARTIVSIVKADFAQEERELTVGDSVRQDEIIEVSQDGRGEFRLEDDTKLALGPGSRLVLDKFVYDSDKKAGSIVLDLTKGAFRFITGVASKPTYLIRTPNASITVRGTIFDLFILADNTVWLLLHEGGIEVSSKGKCRVLDQPGQLMRVTSDGSVGVPVNWKDLPGRDAVPFDEAFPFITKSPEFESGPVMDRAAVIDAAFPGMPPVECANVAPPPIKTRKADDGDKSPPKKRKASNDDDDAGPAVKIRTKTARKPKRDDDDDASGGPNGIGGIGIGIGIGIGGFGGGRRGGGGYSGGHGK